MRTSDQESQVLQISYVMTTINKIHKKGISILMLNAELPHSLLVQKKRRTINFTTLLIKTQYNFLVLIFCKIMYLTTKTVKNWLQTLGLVDNDTT